jgi:hypothetical protein
VVASHYQVDFEAVSSGYVVPVGVEDEVAMNRRTRSPPPPPICSPRTSFTDFLFSYAPAAGNPQA